MKNFTFTFSFVFIHSIINPGDGAIKIHKLAGN